MVDVIVSNIARRNDYESAWAEASTKCEEFRRSLFGYVRAEIVSSNYSSFVLHVRVALRPRLFSAQPTFRNSIEQLVKTADDVIIASLRKTSVIA